MKLKFKALTAAMALAVAGSANAAVDPFSSGDGELFFSVRDNVNNTSFVLDLNVTISAFVADPLQSLSFDVTDFVGSSSGDLSWAVMAGDLTGANIVGGGGLRYLTTSAADSGAALSAMTNNALSTWSIMDTDYVANVNFALAGADGLVGTADDATSATAGSVDSNYFAPSMDFWQGKSPVSATAGLGESQNFFLLSNSESTLLATGRNKPVDMIEVVTNVWKLDTDATGKASLTYSAVPVPPAVWLLGSALMGLVGVARRKSQNV